MEHRLTFRLSDHTLDHVKTLARTYGVSDSEVIRVCIDAALDGQSLPNVKKSHVNCELLDAWLLELGRIEDNVNQIYKQLNNNGVTSSYLMGSLEAIQNDLIEIREIVETVKAR